jgi:phospholipase/carboxylesterase
MRRTLLEDRIEIETSPTPDATVIWLHGLGADGSDFVPVVPALELGGLAVRFVFPHAPMRPVTINGGYVMRAWYDILGMELDRREDEAGVRDSGRIVDGLVLRERERGIAQARIVLAGFSQGGAIALHAGLRSPARLAGILALSCYVPIAAALAGERTPANRDVPIFLAHGTLDPVVPYRAGQRARELLENLDYAVEWHEYRIEHTVSLEEVADIGGWLRRVLA